MDSLYIVSWTGLLMEYVLEPHARLSGEKVNDESPLEVTDIPRAQWSLSRSVARHSTIKWFFRYMLTPPTPPPTPKKEKMCFDTTSGLGKINPTISQAEINYSIQVSKD